MTIKSFTQIAAWTVIVSGLSVIGGIIYAEEQASSFDSVKEAVRLLSPGEKLALVTGDGPIVPVINNDLGISCSISSPIRSSRFTEVVSAFRKENGLNELKETGELNNLAQKQWLKLAEQLKKSGDFEHPGGLPNGHSEILAKGSWRTAEELLEGYKSSQAHREGILNPDYIEMGSYFKEGVTVSVFKKKPLEDKR